MNGAHDLGGTQCFGRIPREEKGQFVHHWEERVFGLTLAAGMLGLWNLDMSRARRESFCVQRYLTMSYYERWLEALRLLLDESGKVGLDEGMGGESHGFEKFLPVLPDQIGKILQRGGPTGMETSEPATYRVGNRVRIANEHPRHHTRMPRYVRGRTGEIISHHGAHVFPDEHAVSGNRIPHHLYGVRFEGEELWGKGHAEEGTVVLVDVFEPYIEGIVN